MVRGGPPQPVHSSAMTPDAIEVREYGSGPGPVMLLHGGPGAPGYMVALARDLATRYRVLEPLQRASGGEPLTVARHVADLAAVTPPGAVLVGSSWGAMLALSFAARHPASARGLALVGCGTYDTSSRKSFQDTLDRRLGPEGVKRIDELRATLDAAVQPEEADRILATLAGLLIKAQCVDPVVSGWDVTRHDARGHLETWTDVLRLQHARIEPGAFAAIKEPVIMIHGSDDPHPGPSTRDTLLPYLPQLEYVELDRCGHLPWVEREARDLFLEVLSRWLDERLASALYKPAH